MARKPETLRGIPPDMTVMLLVFAALLLGAAPASKPSADPQTSIINNAVEDLSKEFTAYLQNPAKPLRTESDYFKQNRRGDVTPEGILKVLERSGGGGGGDPRLEAYVKWQLLSAVPVAFEDKLVQRAGAAYVRAPALQTRPGVTTADQQALSKDLQGNRSKLDEVNVRYQDQIAQYERGQDPILKYRALLMARLPVQAETLAAGYEDVAQRVGAGADYDKFLDSLLASSRNWLLDGKASSGQLAAIAQAIERVKATKPPSYYDKAAISSKGLPYWKTKTAPSPDSRDRLTKLQAALREAALKPPPAQAKEDKQAK